MGENKQVRVDNWGTFFLQRLQTFFNKTDYCDLTLQFDGNVQLKVHRLVMNACTDYFHILEQTCEMIDDVLMMPPDLTPDIILPIVNFMYTGMLEFQMTNYVKLYKAAELMEMPVLTKILDAQKAKYPLRGTKTRSAQQNWNLPHSRKNSPDLPQALPGRKLPVWKRKSAPVTITPTTHQQTSSVTSHFTESKINTSSEPLYLYDNTPKPTRFEWPEEELTNFPLLETSAFDDISYTSKQILTQDEEMRSNSSTFDEVKHLPNLNKRPASYNAPQIDIEEVKNYVKEQKVRSELADYGVDEEDVDNDFSESDQGKRKLDKQGLRSSKRTKFNLSEKENITSTQTTTSGTPTAKISATVSGDVNHTKIISEVLKKYPHLVKRNKNIKLKIFSKPGSKTEPQVAATISSTKTSPTRAEVLKKQPDEGPWTCQKCSTPTEKVEFVLYYLYRKHMTDVHYEKFDSKQCKFCGHRSAGLAMLMYHQYIKHEIKPPSSYKFPKCKQCPYIALSDAMLAKHKSNHSKHDVQCNECKIAFNNRNSLTSHVQITGHTGKLDRTNFDCQYCTKRLPTDSHLFAHIKMSHRDEGCRDGIVGIDELEADEVVEEDLEKAKLVAPKKEVDSSKVKILSNVKIGSTKSGQTSKGSSEQKVVPVQKPSQSIKMSAETDVAASLGLVDIVVLDDNQQYILQSTPQDPPTEYILPDMPSNFTTQGNTSVTQTMLSANSDIASTDELVMVLTDHDYNDGNSEMLNSENNNFVVLYSHPVEGEQENQFITTQGNLIATSQGNLITTQGNLVLNSQTGLIELRDTDSQMLNQGESIEMIQQEINSHKDFKSEPTFDNEKSKVNIAIPMTDKEAIQQIEEAEFVVKDDETKLTKVTSENEKEVSDKILTEEEDLANLVTVKEETDVSNEEQAPAEPPIANITEQKPEATNNDIVDKEVVNASESNADSMTNAIDEKNDGDKVIDIDKFVQLEEEKSKDSEANNDKDKEEIECPEESKEIEEEPTVKEKEISETEKETTEQVITESDDKVMETEPVPVSEEDPVDKPDTVEDENKPNDASEETVNLEENKEIPVDMPEIKEEPPSEMDTDKVDAIVEEEKIPKETVEKPDMETAANVESKDQQQDDGVIVEDDNSKLSENVSENTSESTQKENAAPSTKIDILHDWEDTDSQQSEHPDGNTPKNENTVNKLITDWEDEEEMKD